jgi:hypothetical protein
MIREEKKAKSTNFGSVKAHPGKGIYKKDQVLWHR